METTKHIPKRVKTSGVKLSSKTTYVFPFLLLLTTAMYMANANFEALFLGGFDYVKTLLVPIALSAVLFLVFREVAKLRHVKYLKFGLVLIPLLYIKLMASAMGIEQQNFGATSAVIAGFLLLWSFTEFRYRYDAELSRESIHFKNILGYSDAVPLSSIVKIEQKMAMLSLIKELRFLRWSMHTVVTYRENIDEYEISFYTRAFRADEMFSQIVAGAKEIGNNTIKQYGY